MYARRIVQFALLAGLVTEAAAQTPNDSTKKPKRPKSSSALFSSDSVFSFTLTADYKTVFKNRDTLNVPRHKARLSYVDGSGATVSLPVEIAPRGHFRIQLRNCAFTPLRVIFNRDSTKGTLFAGQKGLKLGTHCQKTGEYEQYTLRDYLAYRALHLVTDKSFKARLAKATYVDTRSPSDSTTRYAMFLESEDELGDRLGAKVADGLRGARFDDIEPVQMTIVGVWEYFIGNTDWSLYALHNVRVLQTENPPTYYAIAYDFDFSGLVSARYATPAPQLGIKKVQDRLYRGACRTAEQAAPAFAIFKEKRPAIYALFDEVPDLDKRWISWARDYFDEFYVMIDQPRRVKQEFGQCVPSA